MSETVYSIFGLKLASGFPFATRLAPGEGVPDLTFNHVDQRPIPEPWKSHPSVFEVSVNSGEGRLEKFLSMYLADGYAVLRYLNSTEFYLAPDKIACYEPEPARLSAIENIFLGGVMSYWLERAGLPVLHACAVNVGGSAVAFLGNKGAGKSSLAASLLQLGNSLLTDDALPVTSTNGQVLAFPSYPTMRMWPNEALHFTGNCDDFKLVHPTSQKRRVPIGRSSFGTFCDRPTTLSRLYIPERRNVMRWGTEVEILPVAPADAVIQLVQHSLIPRLVQALGWQPRRLSFFAEFIRRVSVRHLLYPDGLEFLPAVRDAILKDAGAT